MFRKKEVPMVRLYRSGYGRYGVKLPGGWVDPQGTFWNSPEYVQKYCFVGLSEAEKLFKRYTTHYQLIEEAPLCVG
jgi:hypothetical protein